MIRSLFFTAAISLPMLASATGPDPAASAEAAGAAADAESVRQCVSANLPGETLVARVEIESFDAAGGSQLLNARMWSKREQGKASINVSIEGPPDLAGASYLLVEREGRDDVYMFLPALNRVRRMTGESASSSLWGTDFNYADVRQLRSVTGDGRLSLAADSEHEGRAVRVMNLALDDVEESPYERIEFHIDSETCVPLRIDFFEPGGKARKRMTAPFEKVVRVDGRWTATEFRMQDLRDETETLLRLSDPRFDESLAGRVFNPRTFHLGG